MQPAKPISQTSPDTSEGHELRPRPPTDRSDKDAKDGAPLGGIVLDISVVQLRVDGLTT